MIEPLTTTLNPSTIAVLTPVHDRVATLFVIFHDGDEPLAKIQLRARVEFLTHRSYRTDDRELDRRLPSVVANSVRDWLTEITSQQKEGDNQ